MEIKLTNVARARLAELLADYRGFPCGHVDSTNGPVTTHPLDQQIRRLVVRVASEAVIPACAGNHNYFRFFWFIL